jgi:hypothetical protein
MLVCLIILEDNMEKPTEYSENNENMEIMDEARKKSLEASLDWLSAGIKEWGDLEFPARHFEPARYIRRKNRESKQLLDYLAGWESNGETESRRQDLIEADKERMYYDYDRGHYMFRPVMPKLLNLAEKKELNKIDQEILAINTTGWSEEEKNEQIAQILAAIKKSSPEKIDNENE